MKKVVRVLGLLVAALEEHRSEARVSNVPMIIVHLYGQCDVLASRERSKEPAPLNIRYDAALGVEPAKQHRSLLPGPEMSKDEHKYA